MPHALLLFSLAAGAEPPGEATVRRLVIQAGRGEMTARMLAVERLVGLGIEEHHLVRDAVERLLRSPSRETRLLMLDAIPATREPTLVDAVARCLRDPAWQVRVAAAEVLGRGRTKEAIGLLVAQLQKERHGRSRRAIAGALHHITGLGFGDYDDIWRRWWKEQGAGFVVPEKPPGTRPPAPGERRTAATFYGVPVEESAVVFVVDRSASMLTRERDDDRTRLDVAVEELLGAVGRLDRGARVNVIFFGTEVWAWRKGLATVGAGTRAELEADVRSLTAAGGTYLYDALELALEQEDVEAVYLLSDGEPSGGKYTAAATILVEIRARNRLCRASIHCVAVGLDSWLLKQLAAQNGGTYTRK